MDGKIFVSYRRADNAMAWGLLRDRLIGEFGQGQVFFDQQSIDSGDDWRQVIDRELARAKLVVMVCGRAWAGEQPDGTRRIDAPDDMVRYELARAHQLGLRVEPFLIDAGAWPTAESLPPELKFLADTNVRPYAPGDSPLSQLDNWIDHLKNVVYGKQRVRHYVLQGLWIAWVVTSAVWLLAYAGVLAGPRDGFDRLVQSLATADVSVLDAQTSDTRVAAIEIDEFRELLAGRTPLDPEIMTILVDTLHQAARAQQRCDAQSPIGLALELAPGENGAGNEHYQPLAQALRRLAACRPVVLSCPQSMATAQPPEADVLWLEAITAEPDPAGESAQSPALLQAAVQVAGASLDPAVLRLGAARTELGVVIGDLRQGLPPRTVDDPCGCPWREADRQHCAQQARPPWSADVDSVLRPRPYATVGLTKLLQQADQLVAASAVLIGGDFSRQDRLSVPLAPFKAQVPLVTLHASVVDSVREPFVRMPDGWRYGVALLCAAGVACTMMILWRQVALRPHLYTRRLLASGTFLLLVLGLPLGWAWAAAGLPALVQVAALASFSVWAVAMRVSLAGYEVLINRGDAWRPFDLAAMWRAAARRDAQRWSARFRLAVVVMEAAIGGWAVFQLLSS